MKLPFSLDRLAWWIAWKVAMAIVASLAISAVLIQFAGTWAKPPLESSGLIEQIAGLARAMDAVPAQERPALARKLAFPTFETHWYARRGQLPSSVRDSVEEDNDDPRLAKMVQIIGRPDVRIHASDAAEVDDQTSADPRGYLLAIELSDHSWVTFGTDRRSWGVSRNVRILLTALFICLVAGIAGHRLARPIQQLAKASEQFGSSSRAAPLQLDGPREIREAAAAFNAMQQRIQQLMDGRTAMLMAISHDLRAPLTRMRLRGEFIDDAEQQRKLFRDVDDMQAMIEASLTFFRLDRQDEESTRLDLAELLHTVIDDFRDQGLAVSWSEPPQRLVHEGRPLGLRRALTNLVDNAVKYGNSATVTLRREPRQVVIEIDDNGPGVPPAMIPKLFEPFFRGEPSRNRATGGFGLGLASALSIIRAHGGELTLANRDPHGLRATIALPV